MARQYQGLTLYVRDPDTRTFKALNKEELRYFPNSWKVKGGMIRVMTKEARGYLRRGNTSEIEVKERPDNYWEGFFEITGLEKIG